MNQLSNKLLAVFTALCCVSLIQCASFKSQNSENVGETEMFSKDISSDNITNLLDLSLKNFQNLFSTSEAKQSSLQDAGGTTGLSTVVESQSLVRQQPPFDSLQTIFSTAKYYIKTAYQTYMFLNPEVRFGQCMVKMLYIRYPNVMRLFRVQNLSLLVRRLYFIVTKYMNNLLNGNIFSWFGNGADGMRVSSKVAAISTEDAYPRQTAIQSNFQNAYVQYDPSQILSTYPRYIRQAPRARAHRRTATHRRYSRQVSDSQSNAKNNSQQNMKPSEMREQDDMDSEARIDLSNQALEREADQLFNIDAMFWKSLGIEENSLKRYSLAYCSKEYVSDALKRFVKNVILS